MKRSIHKHTYTHTHTHTYTYTFTHTHIHSHIHIHRHRHDHTYNTVMSLCIPEENETSIGTINQTLLRTTCLYHHAGDVSVVYQHDPTQPNWREWTTMRPKPTTTQTHTTSRKSESCILSEPPLQTTNLVLHVVYIPGADDGEFRVCDVLRDEARVHRCVIERCCADGDILHPPIH